MYLIFFLIKNYNIKKQRIYAQTYKRDQSLLKRLSELSEDISDAKRDPTSEQHKKNTGYATGVRFI